MPKAKIFFIVAIIAIVWIVWPKGEERTFIQGNITEINEESGDMEIEIEAWSTISESGSSAESYDFEGRPKSQTIRVSNPKDYDVGHEVHVKVIKNYEEDVWDLDRLDFEVEKVN